MAKFKVEIDKSACIGCGACTVACDNFLIEGDKAKAVKEEIESVGCSQDAADNCPVNAIKITKIE